MNILLVGEGLVLAGAIERARTRGHVIQSILALSAAEGALMSRAGLPVAAAGTPPADLVATGDCDVLLSINNLLRLDASTLAGARVAAINFHNAPLPAYAGLRATAWAILNGESTHGITWHRMEEAIDTGPILVQRRFPLASDETTASLNARCTAAALESLDELFDIIEAGELSGCPQDVALRSYFGRRDSVPDGGRIDWRNSVASILRLLRACEWGSTPNDFGVAVLVTAEGDAFRVHSGTGADRTGPPGAVLGATEDTLTVACGDGAVRLVLERPHDIEVGQVLPIAARPQDHAAARATGVVAATRTVASLLADQCHSDPNATAIEEGPRITTRAELSQRAMALAIRLVASGVRKEIGVGLLLPAGAEFVIAALGAMIAGGAYVPLNPASPARRRTVEVDEAGITHIVTTRKQGRELDLPGVTVLALDERDHPLQHEAAAALPTLEAGDCAYRIFTSGSTGRPKAVEITHSALLNLVGHYLTALPLRSSDRMTMLAHPTFDAAVADTWPILAAGGTLVVPPPQMLRDPAELIAWLARMRCTCTFVPTAVAERLLAQPWPATTTLRFLLAGGDVLHRRPPVGLPFQLINSYGPTENTVDSLWSLVEPGAGRPLIGRPISGVTAVVLDADGRPVADGQRGELVLGGAQVARGYRGRPDLTAERFQRDPAMPGRTRYRTGDQVRLDACGEYEFHGRIDDQVQLRGIRVEPAEIVALLNADVRVGEAACLPERQGNEVVALVAYVIPASGWEGDATLAEALRLALAAQLPPAIVPRAVILCHEFPRTPAGKIDRAALALTPTSKRTLDDSAPAAPMGPLDPIEMAWRRLLPDWAGARADASFWDLGGDSLGAIDLLLAVEAATQVRIPVGHFLARPTLDGLKALVAAKANSAVIELRAGSGIPVVVWYGLSGDLEDYQHLPVHLDGHRVLGILSPALGGTGNATDSVESLVAQGLAALRRHGVTETPALLGYSWGGLLAFEAARQLVRVGTPPPFVGVIGTAPPVTPRSRAARIAALLRWGTASMGRRLRHRRPTWPRVQAALRRLVWMLGPHGHEPMPKEGAKALQRHHARLGYRYRPAPVLPLQLHVFRDVESRDYVTNLAYYEFEKPDIGWSAWAGREVVVHWLDGGHSALMKPGSIAEIARGVVTALAQVETEPPRDS